MLRSTVPLETTDRGPRTQSDRGERCSEGGFVLVGVVMFVLALTILGLSLFSLSGLVSPHPIVLRRDERH